MEAFDFEQPYEKDEDSTFDFEQPRQIEPIDFNFESRRPIAPEEISKPPEVKPPNIASLTLQFFKDALYGELPEGIGYLQKPVETAVDYWKQYLMTPEEETQMQRRHPNLMAMRYAAASLLPGGAELASPVEREEFAKKPIELQRLEILGETAGWVLGMAAFKWGAEAIGATAKYLRGATWFRMMTNRERGLVIQTVTDMKNAKMSDGQILKTLRNRNKAEYQGFYQEAMKKRNVGEVPIEEPIKPKLFKPVTKVGKEVEAAIIGERKPLPSIPITKAQKLALEVEPKPTPTSMQKENTIELYSGFPLHKFSKEIIEPMKKTYMKHVGDPIWNFVSETIPVKAGKKFEIVDRINKGLVFDYRKDPEFIDLRDDTSMRIQHAREHAKELAQTMAKFPRAEQIRIAQVIKGGITAVPRRYESALETMQKFQELEKDLQKAGILGPDNRFRQLSRKEITGKFKEIKGLDEQIKKLQIRLKPTEEVRRKARKILSEVKDKIIKTEKTTTEGQYTIKQTKWTELNEQRVKDALATRGYAQGEVEQMINRIKDSVVPLEGKKGTLKEIDRTIERIITKTMIEQITKTKKYHPQYMAKARGALVRDINDLANERAEILERIRLHYKMSGKRYLRKAYEKHELEKSFLTKLMSYVSKRPRLIKGYEKRRKDLSHLYRKELGEIEQAPFLAYKGMSEESHDVELAKMFTRISQNKDWAISPKEWANIQAVKVRGHLIPKYEKFKPLPVTPKLGPLSGSLVDPYIWDDLNQAVKTKNDLLKAYDGLLTLWKTGKVVYNPATQARNILSNSILADFGDLPQWRIDIYARTARDFLTKSGYWKEAKENTPMLGKEWAAVEATEFLKEVSEFKDGNFAVKAAQAIAKTLDKPAKLYQFWEQFFKLAIYTNERENGIGIKEAYKKAEHYLFNYQKIPPAIRWAKRWYSPFITFSYKAMPLFAETAIRKPWKVAKYLLLLAGVEEVTRRMMGESKEEVEREKMVLPDYMRKSIFPGQLGHLRIPYKDKYNRSKYLDLSYILPWGDIAEQWGQSHLVGRPFLPSHPAYTAIAEIAFNEIMFTGQDLTNKDLDEGADYWKKIGTQIWRQAMPSLAGSYSYNKLMAAMKDEKDWAGRERSVEEAVFDVFFGLKIRSIDYHEALKNRVNILNKAKIELKKRFKKDLRKILMTTTPDADRDMKRQDRLMEKLSKDIDKIIEKLTRLQ